MMDKRKTIKQQLLQKFSQGSPIVKTVLAVLDLYSEKELDLVEQLLAQGPEKNLKKKVANHLQTTLRELRQFHKKTQRKKRKLEEEWSRKKEEEVLKKLL